jgi:hypothetical protein
MQLLTFLRLALAVFKDSMRSYGPRILHYFCPIFDLILLSRVKKFIGVGFVYEFSEYSAYGLTT